MIPATIRKVLSTNFTQFCLFVISLSLSFNASKILIYLIRPANPYDISNVYAPGNFNPKQNFLRIVAIIVGTVLFYVALQILAKRKQNMLRLVVIALFSLNIFVSFLMPQYVNYVNNVDTFHNGEQLSPANAFNKGKGLYSDLYVLHGAGEDVLLPSLALRLTNQNNGIGGYYFITVTLQLLSVILFGFLLSKLFKSTAMFLALASWFSFGVYSNFFYIRDIFIWLLVLLISKVVLQRSNNRNKYQFLALGSLASITVFFAIDRGIIGLASVAVTLLFTTVFPAAENDRLVFKLPRQIKDLSDAGITLTGVILVQLAAIPTLGLRQYGDFLRISFVDIPKFQGMLFNYPLPGFNQSSYTTLVPLIAASLAAIMLIQLAKPTLAKKYISQELLLAMILLSMGVLFLKAGYGRPDWGHIAYSTPLLFIAVFYILHLYLTSKINWRKESWPVIALLFFLVSPTNSLEVNRLFKFLDLNIQQIAFYAKLPTRHDSYWLPSGVKDTADYIKHHTTDSDKIFVFTQQPIYYYLTDRENPSRFYIPWFADPAPLENQLLSQLKANKPKYIVYSSGDGWDFVDGSSMDARTPLVNGWILDNYKTRTKIGTVTLLSK